MLCGDLNGKEIQKKKKKNQKQNKKQKQGHMQTYS